MLTEAQYNIDILKQNTIRQVPQKRNFPTMAQTN